jgi:hypothetical protein
LRIRKAVLYVKEILTGDLVTTYFVETGGDGSGSWAFGTGVVHFAEGVADFGDSVKPEGYFEAILDRYPLLTPNFSWRFVLYVGLPGIIRIAIGGVVGEGGLTGVIRGVFSGRRRMSLCGRS